MILAHGLGGREDLPVPLWLAVYAGAAALIVSFLALGWLWTTARLRGAAAGRPLPGAVVLDSAICTAILRTVGITGFVVLLGTALFGSTEAASNPAPTWLFVWFWVGLVAISLLFGPIYRRLNPLRTTTLVLRALLADRAPTAKSEGVQRLHFAPAIVGLLAFTWFELVFPYSDSPRAVAVFVLAYAVGNIAAGVWFGPAWHERCDAFEVYFALVARLSPFGRRDDGRVVVRNPLDGLLVGPAEAGITAMILVGLGSTTFDGLTRLPAWIDLRDGLGPAARTAVGTAGLAIAIVAVSLGYLCAIRATRPYLPPNSTVGLSTSFAHSVIPIMVGYTVAHYFSFAVFQGQAGYLLAGDPVDRGWDLFGLSGDRIDYTVVSTAVIAAVQIGAIVAGHILGVISAHDQAIGVLRPGYAKVGQYPMLALMVGYTVVGIYLVSGG